MNFVVPATRVHRVAKTRGSGIFDPGFEIHEGPEYTRKNRKIESTGTAVNDDFRVGSGASPAILRPFRDSHFVTSRRRACRQDVGVLPRKSPGKAHCVWRLPRFTGTGAIHRSFPTFGSFGFPLGQLVRGRSVSDRVEARLLTRPLNFTLWLMQRCLKRGRWAQGTNP